MSIIPESEILRRAVKWISDMRQDSPNRKISDLIADASLRFDLSPGDTEALTRLLKDGEIENIC